MAVVKTIDVAISASTGLFEAAMKRSVISFDALAIASKAGEIAMAGFHAVVDGVSEAMERIDTASKAAASIGIATDQLMRLRFALSEIAGVDPGQTDAMLTRMIRVIAEGGKPAQYALQNIGLSLQALQAMSPEKAFLTIRDAIAALPGQGQKAAAAVALFGKQGASLLPVFSGTSDVLQEAMGFASDFGLAVNSVDAAGIEAANDAMNRLSSILEAVFNQLAVELSPTIFATSMALVDMAKAAWPAIQSIIESIGTLGESLGTVLRILASVIKYIPGLGGISAVITTAVDALQALNQGKGLEAFDFAGSFEKHKQAFEAQLADLAKKQRDAAIGSAPGAEAAAAQKKAIADRQKAMDAAQKEMARRQKAQEDAVAKAAAERQREMERQAKERQAAIEKLRSRGESITESVQTPIEQFASKIAELQRLQRGGFISQETFRRAFGEARQEFTQGLADDMQPVFDAIKGPAAITGGPLSGEAFSAFQEAKRGQDLQKEQTEYQKRMAANLDVMVRRGIILAQANLSGKAKT